MGSDVESVTEHGKFGLPDTEVLRQATETGRVVLTHDSDFGGLALGGAKFVGIIYLRPGHIRADFTIRTLEAIRDNAPEVTPPFILVPPHFHAHYGEHQAEINIETFEILNGKLPQRVLGLALEWAVLHRDELRADWERARKELPLEPIQPLE